MREDLKVNLLDLIQSAVDLANSIQQDVKDGMQVTEETVIYLNDFRQKHDALENILDVINGVN